MKQLTVQLKEHFTVQGNSMSSTSSSGQFERQLDMATPVMH